MPDKKRIFLITALLYILYMVFPLFKDTLSIPVWLPSVATLAVLSAMYPQAYSNKTFYWFLAYACSLILYFIGGLPLTIGIGSIADSKRILVECANILPCISIFSVLVYLNDERLNRTILKWSTGILLVSFIVAVPLMLRFNSIREAMNEENHEEIIIAGLPSYALMHAYTLFLPVLCYCVKVLKGRSRVLAMIGLVVMCFVVYDTFVTTSLILMILILLFTFLLSERKGMGKWFAVFFLSIVFFLLYQSGFFVSIIDLVMPAFEGTAVEPKLLDMKESMMQGHVTGDSLTGRQDYHGMSINSFFSNPLFGGGMVGGHSSLLDRLGGMGLVAGLPFIMIFVSFFKRIIRIFKTTMAKEFFVVGFIVAFVYLINKGNWGGESWLLLMVLLPFGLLVAENSAQNQLPILKK